MSPARTWAAGAAALLVPSELADSVPACARWVLAGITSPTGLWRAETALMARVEQDGLRLLRAPGLDRGVVLGAVAVMACHAWRIRAALELAARGGAPVEAFDELG